VESEIREKLASYLRGEMSLEGFREWLVGRTWNRSDAPAVAHEIAYFIDEAASGNCSRTKLDRELRRLSAVADRAVEVARS
jgi:hypothetical protein